MMELTRRAMLCLGACWLAACGTGDAVPELRIGTATLGGAFYPLGQGIAGLVTSHADGLSMVPVVTQGAVDNGRLLANGEIELGITNADLAYFAFHGLPPYTEPLPIRAAGALHPSVLHLVVREGDGITSFADLRGRRVAVGPAGGPTSILTALLLEAEQMSMDDIVPSFLSYSDGFSQLGDGNVDAAFALAGYPAAAVVQARASHRLALLDIDEALGERILADKSYYRLVEMPADVYDVASDTTVLAVDNVLIVHADQDPEVVHRIVSAVYGNLPELARNNAVARRIVPEQSLELPIPLHDGALRYFERL